ncbi:MAG: AraC family transcriptional regulator [Paenibacillaceae bacterium]
MSRPDGYPCYHWLQTLEGEGTISFGGRTCSLPPHSGVLLFPGVAHTYQSVTDSWVTLYLTFDGSLATEILLKLGMERSASFQWPADVALSSALWELIEVMDEDGHLSGLDGSAHIFKLLTGLKKHAVMDDRASLSIHFERLGIVVDWLELYYADPNIGLDHMAHIVEVSTRYLNRMFNSAFGVSAYQYLISFRISKAKMMLSGQPDLTIGQVAALSGYRDTSHFIAAFRKLEGTTPQKFKALYHQ